MVFGVRYGRLQGTKALTVQASDQQPSRAPHEALADRGNFRWRLAEGKDYLGQEIAQSTMVVNLGEVQVFVREVAQIIQRGVHAQGTIRNCVEEQP